MILRIGVGKGGSLLAPGMGEPPAPALHLIEGTTLRTANDHDSAATCMDSLGLTLFLGVTVGHFALSPYWLARWWGRRFAVPEEFLFHSILFGFGTLQAVLHVLACTIGISLTAGVVALLLLHALLHVASRNRAPDALPHQEPQHSTLADVPVLSLIGGTAVVTSMLSWFVRAPHSLQILGIDAEHYHVPYAVNFALGESIFGFAATPHLYPMGTSILAAWFFQPFADPLLLDLTNLFPFLLLFVSCVYLFTLLTDESGLDWAPAIFLLLFTGRLFRVSIFISADLFYAASFAALFTQLCAIWVRWRIETREWLMLALSTGMLLSSKIQGLMSAGLLLGLFASAVVIRYVARREKPHMQQAVGTAIVAATSFLASGGIWLVRNWVLFGSPMAPAGLRLFGLTIFPGVTARGENEPLSILKDMHTIPGYNLWDRFVFYTRDWVGIWPALLAAGVAILLLDALYQFTVRRHIQARTARKLFVLLFFTVLCAVHCYVLAGVTFSSLEWLHGQTLRFILPLFAVYAVITVTCFFTETVPWVSTLRLKWVFLLPALLYLLLNYNTLSQMPAQWNRLYGREDLLDYRFAPLALLMVAPWLLRLPQTWRRYTRYAVAGIIALAGAAFVPSVVAQHDQLVRSSFGQFDRDVARFAKDASARTIYRGVYQRVVAYERQRGSRCGQRRLFVMSRFDFPLELQDPGFHNSVFDVQDELTRIGRLLRSAGPGHGVCDYVVAVFREASEKGTQYSPVNETEIPRLLFLHGPLETVGDFDRYRVYHARHG